MVLSDCSSTEGVAEQSMLGGSHRVLSGVQFVARRVVPSPPPMTETNLRSKPETRNLKPETRNPEPETRNKKSCTSDL
jgi:hypothetical protein